MSEFWIMLTGALVASSCGFIGCFLVIRKMTMIGDAISHAILPGIVVGFLLTESRESLPIIIGAAIFGLLCTELIQRLINQGVQNDAAISVVFTALFAIGVVLVSLFTRQVDLDLQHVLYGEIAYVAWDTWSFMGYDLGPRAVWIVGGIFLVNLIIISLFFKEWKITSFDPALAATLGIPVAIFHHVLMGMVSVTTVAAFESVGAILVVAMLVIPAATAYLLTERLSLMLSTSIIIGILSSIGGYGLAVVLDASIAGCMAVVAGFLFVLAMFFSPTQGIVVKAWKRKNLQIEYNAEEEDRKSVHNMNHKQPQWK